MKTRLVVDDSKVVRMVARKILEELEFEVSEAADGQQALDACKSKMPDVILLDWNMPVMDGLEFVQTLRSVDLPKRIPVIMVTTEGSHERMNEATISGADGYILKPVTTEQLQNSLKDYLSRE